MTNLPMTPELERLLREQMATGQFQSASEAVTAALRLLEDRPHASAEPDNAFGLWSQRAQDGLVYQQTLRAEWGR